MTTVTLHLDKAAAAALAAVLRSVSPGEYAVESDAWFRALDEILPQLPSLSLDMAAYDRSGARR